MHHKRKRASLSLSINAIVILILAITMLGLGLTFMRGLFKQMEIKVSEAVSASELTNPPTIDNVMTLAPSDITLRTDTSGEVLAAFLNTGGTRDCGLRAGAETASAGVDVANLVYSGGAPNEVNMVTDQINTWLIAVEDDTGTPGTGIYTLIMDCAGAEVSRKDLLVTVTS